MVQFKDFLQEQMKREGIGVSELARRVGVSHPSVIGWLKGAIPRPKRVEPIARALGVSKDDMYEALGWVGEIGELSTQERRIVSLLRELNPDDVVRLEQIGRLLLGHASSADELATETASGPTSA